MVPPSILVVVLILGGVLTAAAQRAAGDEASLPRIRLERADSGTTWRATYLLERPTGRLRFQRTASFYREDVWTIMTPGWSLQRNGDEQLLVGEPGTETQRVIVEFPVYTQNIVKEYELFVSFTDGSVAIYTGHLYVTSDSTGTPEDETAFIQRLEMVPPAGQRGVVQGKLFDSRHHWQDPHGDGTFVYFGSIAPIESADMIGIVDPGAPSWMVARMNETLPAMFALYAEKFGEPLPWKPVVLFSFDTADVGGREFGGGALTGLVQMSARGRGWLDETPESSEEAFYLIAHEAAHFWNGQLHPYRAMSDSWMHEGSADAFASRLLHAYGAIDEDRLVARRTKALNACAEGLRDGPLVESDRRGQFRNYYACGEIVAVWSTAALPGDGATDRLFDIWRTVFARADPGDRHYDRATYFEALAVLGADDTKIDALREFIDGTHPDPASALIDFMGTVGIEIEKRDRPPLEDRMGWAVDVVRHLMSTACNDRFSYRTEGHSLRTFPIEDCAGFDREMLVISIEGHPIHPAGDLGLRAAVKRCERGEPVTIGLEDGTQIQLTCSSPLRARPAPLAFPE